MSDRIYCYPDSDVLMNKLNIHDAEKFQEAERKLTMLRLIDLLDRPVVGKFDFKHSSKNRKTRIQISAFRAEFPQI